MNLAAFVLACITILAVLVLAYCLATRERRPPRTPRNNHTTTNRFFDDEFFRGGPHGE